MSTTAANIFLGTGRRKTSTARVRLTDGTGKLTVNGRDVRPLLLATRISPSRPTRRS